MLFFAQLFPLCGGLFLGWTLGANDASNVYGTAVATRIIKFRTAAMLCAVMVVIGAVMQGEEGIKTLSGITEQSIPTAVLVSVAAAITGTIMTFFKLPVSTSQAVVGAIMGVGLATGNTEYGGLIKVVLCWIGTPIGSLLVSIVLHKLLSFLLLKLPIGIFTRDKILWFSLLVVGLYGSYALGANNVANTTGMFSGLIPGVEDEQLTLIGGAAIALGVLTYSKRVMLNVGKGIMTLDAFTALVAVSSMSLTVHLFAVLGAPVSTSQGIVGAILGIGMLRGSGALHFNVLKSIAYGWLLTPALALLLAAAGFAIFL